MNNLTREQQITLSAITAAKKLIHVQPQTTKQEKPASWCIECQMYHSPTCAETREAGLLASAGNEAHDRDIGLDGSGHA